MSPSDFLDPPDHPLDADLDVAGPAVDEWSPRTKAFYRWGSPATIHLPRCRLITTVGRRVLEHAFEQAEVSIGSLDDNDLVVSDDTVSRHHCRIVQEDNAWVLVDLGSTNGTFVDRVRIREAFLSPGCTIGLGKVEVRFEAADEEVEIVPSDKERLGAAIGRSVQMRELFAVVEKIAPTGTTVVIEGETGTGKEVIAKEIHRLSPRGQGALMVLDCGAVPPNLIESELFGHERGAFTGAVATRQGLFELAHGGTLFLDELCELPLDLQPKLLRALESREVRRVGGSRSFRVDVRIIAATNRDLEQEVAAGRFREDLFYRLSVVRLRVPSLRERPEDIALLVRHLLGRLPGNRHPSTNSPKIREVSPAAMARLVAYRFPGNVRELVNVIERAVSLSDSSVLEERDLPAVVRQQPDAPDPEPPRARPLAAPSLAASLAAPAAAAIVDATTFKEAKERLLSSFEREYLSSLLRKTGGNISQAAREADIDRKYFRKLMRKYEVGDEPDDAGDPSDDD